MRATSGETVTRGYFFSPKTLDLVSAGETPTVLPGAPGTTYVRVPDALLVVLAPVLGLAFVVFLPAVGILLTAQVAGEAMWHQLGALWTRFAPVAAPPELLGQTALTKKHADEGEHTKDPAHESLAKEVARRREQGER